MNYDALFKEWYGRDPTTQDKINVFDKLLGKKSNKGTSSMFKDTARTLTELLEGLQEIQEELISSGIESYETRITEEKIRAAIGSVPFQNKKKGFLG